jgi:hypothetical protein
MSTLSGYSHPKPASTLSMSSPGPAAAKAVPQNAQEARAGLNVGSA